MKSDDELLKELQVKHTRLTLLLGGLSFFKMQNKEFELQNKLTDEIKRLFESELKLHPLPTQKSLEII